MQILILENDHHVRQHVAMLIRRIRPHWVVVEAESIADAVLHMELNTINAIFADVHLDDGCFFDDALTLPDRCALVVMTGDETFALRAIQREAIDYLLKPIGLERLLDAVEKVERRCVEKDLIEIRPPAASRVRYVHKSAVRFCALEDIVFVRANLKSCDIVLRDGEVGLVQYGINAFESVLPRPKFLRIHRSYILNIDAPFQVIRDDLGRMFVDMQLLNMRLPVSKPNERKFRNPVLVL